MKQNDDDNEYICHHEKVYEMEKVIEKREQIWEDDYAGKIILERKKMKMKLKEFFKSAAFSVYQLFT